MLEPLSLKASLKAHLGKRSRRKEARPAELLQAALALFVEKGFAATRAEEVAARAGVSKGTLFLYFPSKEALFKAVVREGITGRLAQWQQQFDSFTGSSADLLRHGMQLWWQNVGATPLAGITKLVMSEARSFPEIAAFYQSEVVEPGLALIRSVLARGVARGEFVLRDPDYAVYSVVAPMVFLVMQRETLGACCHPQQVLEPERYLKAQLDIVLNGLLSATAPTTPADLPPREPTPLAL